MKKQLLALTLALILIVSLVGCSKDIKLRQGSTYGNVYTNTDADITFTKSDTMEFASKSEIAELMDVSEDIIANGKEIFDSMDITSFIDFLALDTATGNNVALTFEDLSKTGNANMSMDEYIKISKENIIATGVSYTFEDESEVKLGGKTYAKLVATTTYYGVSMTQAIYVRKIGHYIALITVTVVDGTPVSTYEAMFS